MVVFFDTETTIKGPKGREPWVFWPENRIVVAAAAVDDGPVMTYWDVEELREVLEQADVWVAHNAGFDAHHVRRAFGEAWWAKHVWHKGIVLYDTMAAEHVLTGQTSGYISLDKLAERNGGTLKDERLKEFWKAGVQTEDIPRDIIEPYVIEDVENTRRIYRAQQERAVSLKMEKVLAVRMDAIVTTLEMEFNGLYFQPPAGMREQVTRQRDEAEVACVATMRKYLPDMPNLTPASALQVRLVLYGGHYTVPVKEPMLDANGAVVRFKSGPKKGEVRYRNGVENRNTKGLGLHPQKIWCTPAGAPGTGKEVFADLTNGAHADEVDAFARHVLAYRFNAKMLSTYLEGYAGLALDGIIHQELSHCSTITGRLSCSKPNLQNVSAKDMKD